MKNKYSKKAEIQLQKVVEAFKNGNIADTCRLALFPMPDIPAAKWTFRNRWLAVLQTGGEVDCRGFRQWEEAGRKVKKGSYAAFILRPRLITKDNEETGEKEQACVGFAGIPVFSAGQTEGDPLEYENISIPDIPLLDVAKAWNIDIQAGPYGGDSAGFWAPEQKRIFLASPDARVFYHELTHAAHTRLSGPKKPGLKHTALLEIVAELGAECLRQIFGSSQDTSGNSYAYIEEYAKDTKNTTLDACLQVLNETAKVISLILETAAELGNDKAA